MRRSPLYLAAAASLMLAGTGGACAHAQVVPSSGYTGPSNAPGVAARAEAGAPRLRRLPDASMADLIRVDPAYRRGTVQVHAKVVGAFAIAETRKARVQAAWAPGFLPITLAFGDGRCFALQAEYIGGTLSNGRLRRTSCEGNRTPPRLGQPSAAPVQPGLRLIGSAWSYDAWADERHGTTIIAMRNRKVFTPLFTAQMTTSAIMAMDSPDAPMGNITLVGRVKGRLTVLTIEASY